MMFPCGGWILSQSTPRPNVTWRANGPSRLQVAKRVAAVDGHAAKFPALDRSLPDRNVQTAFPVSTDRARRRQVGHAGDVAPRRRRREERGLCRRSSARPSSGRRSQLAIRAVNIHRSRHSAPEHTPAPASSTLLLGQVEPRPPPRPVGALSGQAILPVTITVSPASVGPTPDCR